MLPPSPMRFNDSQPEPAQIGTGIGSNWDKTSPSNPGARRMPSRGGRFQVSTRKNRRHALQSLRPSAPTGGCVKGRQHLPHDSGLPACCAQVRAAPAGQRLGERAITDRSVGRTHEQRRVACGPLAVGERLSKGWDNGAPWRARIVQLSSKPCIWASLFELGLVSLLIAATAAAAARGLTGR